MAVMSHEEPISTYEEPKFPWKRRWLLFENHVSCSGGGAFDHFSFVYQLSAVSADTIVWRNSRVVPWHHGLVRWAFALGLLAVGVLMLDHPHARRGAFVLAVAALGLGIPSLVQNLRPHRWVIFHNDRGQAAITIIDKSAPSEAFDSFITALKQQIQRVHSV